MPHPGSQFRWNTLLWITLAVACWFGVEGGEPTSPTARLGSGYACRLLSVTTAGQGGQADALTDSSPRGGLGQGGEALAPLPFRLTDIRDRRPVLPGPI
jgi:hypothetical protein